MKKIIKLIILCVIFMQYSGIKAQQFDISVESIMGFPSQAHYNQSYNFIVFLHNIGNTDYQGSLYIAFHTDSSNVIDTGSFDSAVTVNIPMGSFDSVNVSGFYFDPQTFKLGGNVVVVWPVSSNGSQIMVTDSFYTVVEILGYAGISDIYQSYVNNNIYPVPACEELFLPQNIAENSIEHVRIIDVLGRTKILLKHSSKSVSVTELDNGFYFLEVKEKNNQIKIFKFIVYR